MTKKEVAEQLAELEAKREYLNDFLNIAPRENIHWESRWAELVEVENEIKTLKNKQNEN